MAEGTSIGAPPDPRSGTVAPVAGPLGRKALARRRPSPSRNGGRHRPQDEEPVDDSRGGGPFARRRARLPVVLRALVVRRRGRQEDAAPAVPQLRVRYSPFWVRHPPPFSSRNPNARLSQSMAVAAS